MNHDKSVITILKKLKADFELSASGNYLYLDGIKTTSRTLQTRVQQLDFGQDPNGLQVRLLSFQNKSEYTALIELTYQTALSKLKRQQAEEFQPTSLDRTLNYTFSNITPIRDIESGRRYIYSGDKDCILSLDYDTWYDSLPPDKDLRMSVLSSEIRALVKYNPYKLSSKIEIDYEGQRIYQFNGYTPPTWRLSRSEGKSGSVFFSKLIQHLFPSDRVQNFVLNWLRNMLLSRNDTALLMVSLMGTGKGILCQVAEKLVGRGNFQKQGEGFFKTQFNAELVDKRLIVFDETPVNNKNKEQFKLLLNNTIPIEKKGVDVQPAVDNFASFIITNNLISENKLEYKDRRFSVPEMTDKPLSEVYSEEEITAFMDSLNEESVISDIGWYILDHCDFGFSVNYAWKEDRFYHLMIYGLSEWKKFIMETVQSCKSDEYTIKDLKYDYEEATGIRQFAGRVAIESFLAQFRDRDGDRIATVARSGNEFKVLPTTKYLPETKLDAFDDLGDFDI